MAMADTTHSITSSNTSKGNSNSKKNIQTGFDDSNCGLSCLSSSNISPNHSSPMNLGTSQQKTIPCEHFLNCDVNKINQHRIHQNMPNMVSTSNALATDSSNCAQNQTSEEHTNIMSALAASLLYGKTSSKVPPGITRAVTDAGASKVLLMIKDDKWRCPLLVISAPDIQAARIAAKATADASGHPEVSLIPVPVKLAAYGRSKSNSNDKRNELMTSTGDNANMMLNTNMNPVSMPQM